MDNKFPSQQAALREAFTMVLGAPPVRGQVTITEEQRKKIGEVMMGWLAEGRWSIRPGTRAAENPLNYIIGRQPTCLIEAWVAPKQAKQPNSAPPPQDKMAVIKAALEAGLITQEQAQQAAMKLLGL